MNALLREVSQPQPTTLDRIMLYRHEGLIERLEEKMGLSVRDAEILFGDMKRFLFLCYVSEERLAPSTLIDECWHNFILFTKDYHRFCTEHFGTFIHHAPKTKAERAVADGSMKRRTIMVARQILGDHALTTNWAYAASADGKIDFGDCNGSTNCQDSTADPPDK